jgi:hypothetical protein
MSSPDASNETRKVLILYSRNADAAFAIQLRQDLDDVGVQTLIGGPVIPDQQARRELLVSFAAANTLLLCVSLEGMKDRLFLEELSITSQQNEKKLIVVILLDDQAQLNEIVQRVADKIIDGRDYANTFPTLARLLCTGTTLGAGEDHQPATPQILSPVSSETLDRAAFEAAAKLEELKNSTGEKYNLLTNEEALVGHLPRWHHLYMGAYGAFTRTNKERQILSDVDRCVGRLVSKKYGLLLHVVTGDSGCGKSTLAKQIIRRLIQKDDIQEFSNLQNVAAEMKFFEVRESGKFQNLEEEIKQHIQPYATPIIYFIYVDDLFVLEDADLNRLLQALKFVSDKAAIYLFATSPNWIFDGRDLQEKKKTFQLLVSIDTRVEGIDSFDREALKSQYLEMHQTDYRPELLEELEQAGEVLILFKLALHHNLTYSQYFDQLFQRLEKREPKYLAALLLFSTLARFYVHFPVTLLRQLNLELDSKDRLWETPYAYETINDAGLRLFRVRRGTRGPHNPQGLPDTIAPFHDRVAQVIYETWGENRKVVPAFNCRLRDLKNTVYEKLDEDSQTRHILSNIFRGHLRVSDDNELRQFVEHFGPVRGNDWILADEPLATTRWLKFSKYSLGRTNEFRRRWQQVLTETSERSVDEKIDLTLALLSPEKLREPKFKSRILSISLEDLRQEYGGILLAVLDGFLSSLPLPLDSLAEYLFRLNRWLDRHSQPPKGGLSGRYRVILSLTNNTAKMYSTLRRDEKINQALASVVKCYLKNLATESSTYEVLGVRGLLPLVRRIQWQPQDAAELTEALLAYLTNRGNVFRPVIFEHLLQFARIAHYTDTKTIWRLFLDICQNDTRSLGLTYTAAAFWRYVIQTRQDGADDDLALKILSDLTAGKLADLETSPIYPDFIGGLLDRLIHTNAKGSPKELLAMLTPLVTYWGNSVETPYVFYSLGKLNGSFLQLADASANVVDRQIRLCFARRLKVSVEEAVAEFVDLLINDLITISTSLVPLLKDYLDDQNLNDIAPGFLSEHKSKFYNWLGRNQERSEAAVYFTLAVSPVFFDAVELKGLWKVAVRNINLIPHRLHRKYFPVKFFEWWLSPTGNANDQEATRAILDAFWQYSLENSHLEFGKKFTIYTEFFLFLIPRYGLYRDERWWGRALVALVEYLATIVEKPAHQPQRRFRIKKDSDTEVALYKKRLCLEKILDSVLDQFEHHRDSLGGEFEAAVRGALWKYGTQAWAARWLLRLNPDETVDGTAALLNYVTSLRIEEAIVFDLRNQVDWWYAWLAKSNRDPLAEVNRLAAWFNQASVKGIAVFFLSSLLEVLRKQRVKQVWGPLILRVLEGSTAEFSDKSVLVKNYIGFMKAYSSSQGEELAQELLFLERIALGYLEEAKLMSSSKSSAYGLQTIFEAALEFDFSLDQEKAEETFLLVCGAQMMFAEGGAIARYFFPWRLRQHADVDIVKYIKFIETNLYKEQAPYVLTHLLSALRKESVAIGSEGFGKLGNLLKLVIAERLDSTGTSVAMEIFFERLVAESEAVPECRNELETISRDVFALIQGLIHRERTIYLLTSFLPFWKGLIASPTASDVLYLWGKLLFGKLSLIEPFAKFTRNLGKHLEATNDSGLSAEFHDSMIAFAETRPGHPLSAKLFSQLTREEAQIIRIGDLLPQLISNQNDLEDVAYAIGRFLQKGASVLDDDERVRYEQWVIVTLTSNLSKSHSALCVKLLLGSCTPSIHYREVTELFRSFLRSCRDQKLVNEKGDITRTIEAYHKYESESEIEVEVRKANLEACLLIIQNTTEDECGAKHYKAILKTWKPEFIPEQLAMQTLRTLMFRIHPSLWQQILGLVIRLSSLFGASALVCPGVSLEVIKGELDNLKQEGLISMKRRLDGVCESRSPPAVS